MKLRVAREFLGLQVDKCLSKLDKSDSFIITLFISRVGDEKKSHMVLYISFRCYIYVIYVIYIASWCFQLKNCQVALLKTFQEHALPLSVIGTPSGRFVYKNAVHSRNK